METAHCEFMYCSKVLVFGIMWDLGAILELRIMGDQVCFRSFSLIFFFQKTKVVTSH